MGRVGKRLESYNCSGRFLAIIFACYNRIEKTKACLDSLEEQLEKLSVNYKFYICDDNSTDGTFEMLQRRLPNSRIIRTEGDYYWSKSMYVAMKAAKEDSPEYYLMLNDDVIFNIDAIDIMFESYHLADIHPCGVVGTTVSILNNEFTYGGRNHDTGEIIQPSHKLNTCKVANWNCFLIDAETVNKVGIIDGKYEHGGGDFDYSYRMNKKGIPIYVAYESIGQCETNNISRLFQSTEFSRINRLKFYFSRKGCPPKSMIKYHYRTKGIRGILSLLFGYCYAITKIMLKKEL